MVAPTCFGITLPSSGSFPSVLWQILNREAVDRILWMGVLCLVTWCVAISDLRSADTICLHSLITLFHKDVQHVKNRNILQYNKMQVRHASILVLRGDMLCRSSRLQSSTSVLWKPPTQHEGTSGLYSYLHVTFDIFLCVYAFTHVRVLSEVCCIHNWSKQRFFFHESCYKGHPTGSGHNGALHFSQWPIIPWRTHETDTIASIAALIHTAELVYDNTYWRRI
jgi:hypothetical protein